VSAVDELEVQPCEGAYRDVYLRDDVRLTDDPAKIRMPDNASPTWWYDSGVNHRTVDGNIVRSFTQTGWFVDVATLEDLVAFMDIETNSGSSEVDIMLGRPYDAKHLVRLVIVDTRIEFY
jgi:hypothetical protein